MTTAEHLSTIIACCNAEIGRLCLVTSCGGDLEHHEIAALCAFRSTIAAIDRLAFDTTGNTEAIKLILSFWPEETL